MSNHSMPNTGESVLDLPTLIKLDLEAAFRSLGLQPTERMLELRSLQFPGTWGYASPACYALAGQAKQSPQQLADTVVSRMATRPSIERIEALRGYLNFHVAIPSYASRLVAEVLAKGSTWGAGSPKTGRVMVEYAQPNTHKAVHVGHLRNIALGAAVVNILRFAGWEVIPATYPGDIGMHVIKCLWCYLKYHNGEEPPMDRGRWLAGLYVESDARLEYKKHVLELLGIALRDHGLSPKLKEGVQALTASDAQARDEVVQLLQTLETLKQAGEPSSPQVTDEEFDMELRGDGLNLDRISSSTIRHMWHLLDPLISADHDLSADYADLTRHLDWLEQVPEWRQEVRELFLRWEAQDPTVVELWSRTRQWSLDEFTDVFAKLDAPIEVHFYESEVEREGRAIVEELIQRDIAEDLRPKEPVIIRIDQKLREHPLLGEKYRDQLWRTAKDGTLTEREPYRVLVVLRSDSTTLYATKDLALAKRKFEDFQIDRSIYVIDVRQSMYMQQIFKVLELWGFPQADQCFHLAYEMVGTKEGAFSSRKGNAPLYDDFEREALQRARTIVDQKQAELVERGIEDERRLLRAEERDNVARAVAFGGIKMGMLSKDNNTVIAFDWEEALNPNTQSAPYIQYAHARTCSLLDKAAAVGISPLDDLMHKPMYDYSDLDSAELALLEIINRFPEEVERAASTLKPVIIATYLFTLADALNTFWQTCPILKAPNIQKRHSRVALVAATRHTLANGVRLLGIAAPEVM